MTKKLFDMIKKLVIDIIIEDENCHIKNLMSWLVACTRTLVASCRVSCMYVFYTFIVSYTYGFKVAKLGLGVNLQ